MKEQESSAPVGGVVERIEVHGQEAAVVVRGEIDLASSPPLRRALSHCLEQGVKHITVDMGGVTFMDSTGLSSLAQAANALGPGGVTVSNPQRPIRRLLSLAGMEREIEIEPADPPTAILGDGAKGAPWP